MGLIEAGTMVNESEAEDELIQVIMREDCNNALLKKFASAIQLDRRNGIIKEVTPVIDHLNSQEISHLFDFIIYWASEFLNIKIMYPNEYEQCDLQNQG